jgi:hypothetical protein
MTHVYHFTDTAHLPWILRDGVLRAAENNPGPSDFLWATTDQRGDQTATVHFGNVYREGIAGLVRFTLHARDFEDWRELAARTPGWTAQFTECLEQAARDAGSNSANWRARVKPLLRTDWVEIASRSYRDKVWRPLPLDTAPRTLANDALAVTIGKHVFASWRHADTTGRLVYTFDEPVLAK